MSPDCQKVGKVLIFILAYKPTGVSEDPIISMATISMAIAKHLEKREKISCHEKDVPQDQWMNHLEFKILRKHSKFLLDINNCKCNNIDDSNSPPEE